MTARGERDVPRWLMVWHREDRVKREDKEEEIGREREREQERER